MSWFMSCLFAIARDWNLRMARWQLLRKDVWSKMDNNVLTLQKCDNETKIDYCEDHFGVGNLLQRGEYVVYSLSRYSYKTPDRKAAVKKAIALSKSTAPKLPTIDSDIISDENNEKLLD